MQECLPRCAVILAAGIGQRLEPVWRDRPKGFIELAGLPIVERSIQQLIAYGIVRIVVVTGYAAEYYRALAHRYPMLQLVHNEYYATSGHMYSLYCARHWISGDFLLLESDMVYERRGLATLLHHATTNAILTSGFTQSGDEVFVSTAGDRVVKLSKDAAELANITGELVGITKISQAMFAAMVAHAEWHFQHSLNLPYEACINGVTSALKVGSCHVEDLVWAEIDTPAHLARVQQIIWPCLRSEWQG